MTRILPHLRWAREVTRGSLSRVCTVNCLTTWKSFSVSCRTVTRTNHLVSRVSLRGSRSVRSLGFQEVAAAHVFLPRFMSSCSQLKTWYHRRRLIYAAYSSLSIPAHVPTGLDWSPLPQLFQRVTLQTTTLSKNSCVFLFYIYSCLRHHT